MAGRLNPLSSQRHAVPERGWFPVWKRSWRWVEISAIAGSPTASITLFIILDILMNQVQEYFQFCMGNSVIDIDETTSKQNFFSWPTQGDRCGRIQKVSRTTQLEHATWLYQIPMEIPSPVCVVLGMPYLSKDTMPHEGQSRC